MYVNMHYKFHYTILYLLSISLFWRIQEESILLYLSRYLLFQFFFHCQCSQFFFLVVFLLAQRISFNISFIEDLLETNRLTFPSYRNVYISSSLFLCISNSEWTILFFHIKNIVLFPFGIHSFSWEI